MNSVMVSTGDRRRVIYLVAVFSVAMAALESAVVVYLRALYYPDGFTVAMKLIEERILLVELVRELATLVMLFAVAWIAGRTFIERLAFFMVAFGVWDIFYYVWLKVFIGWPASLMEWDILFLIPWTWLGPVLAPVICSLTMIVFGLVLLGQARTTRLAMSTSALVTAGATVILYTFLADYGFILATNGFFADFSSLMQNPKFLEIASSYIPDSFRWGWFLFGELLIVSGIVVEAMKERMLSGSIANVPNDSV